MSLVDPFRNFGRVAVSGGYDHLATAISLVPGEVAKLPSVASEGAFTLLFWNVTDYPDPVDDPNKELVRVTGISGNVLTVQRAQEGTTATVKNLAGKEYRMAQVLTADQLTRLKKIVEGSYVEAVLVGVDPGGQGSYTRVSIAGLSATGRVLPAWGLNDQADPSANYSPPLGALFISEVGNGYVDVRSNTEESVDRRIVLHVYKWA
jgi:hypothetical protein